MGHTCRCPGTKQTARAIQISKAIIDNVLYSDHWYHWYLSKEIIIHVE